MALQSSNLITMTLTLTLTLTLIIILTLALACIVAPHFSRARSN